jgi:methylmalonyl-CoA carboxyltransferase large subunit
MASRQPDLTAALEAIQQTLESLSTRVARLEAQLVDVYAHEDEEQLPVAVVEHGVHLAVEGRDEAAGEIDPDVVLAIAAAVAAHLGVRAHVKQIRLVGSQAWGRQGRVSVQASHRLYR